MVVRENEIIRFCCLDETRDRPSLTTSSRRGSIIQNVESLAEKWLGAKAPLSTEAGALPLAHARLPLYPLFLVLDSTSLEYFVGTYT